MMEKIKIDGNSLLEEYLYGLQKLKKYYEKEREDTYFFVSDRTTEAYKEYLSVMQNRVDSLLRQIQSEW